MWKLRRWYKLLNSPYSMYFGRTHVANMIPGVKFSLISGNLKFPYDFKHETRFSYCNTSLDCSIDAPSIKYEGVVNENDENECEEGEGGGLSEEDDDGFEKGSLGLKDEEFNRKVEFFLDILRRKSGVAVGGVEVAKKLKECGNNPTLEVVNEVLRRTRNDWELAFMFFLWSAKQEGYEHSTKEYHLMISILAKRRKFDTAWTLIEEMRKKGIVDRVTLLIMVRRYSAVHDVANAINTFHAFKRFDLPIEMDEFHNLLSALCRYKNVQEAEHLLFSNIGTFPFNTKSFNTILNGWCNIVGSPREGKRFWRLMVDQEIERDVISYSIMLSCYSKFNKVRDVIKLFARMKEMRLKLDRKSYNAVVYALGKSGRTTEAVQILHTMEAKGIAPDAVTFNSLIKTFCIARNRDQAQQLFDEMMRRGFQPSNGTFHAFFHVLSTEEEIFTLLNKMRELGRQPKKDTYLLLIKKLLKWQKFDKVFMLWDEMEENGLNDDSSSYAALIHGLFVKGKLEEALKFYLEMKKKSLRPDAKTDELIQQWLSNKHMGEVPMINPYTSCEDSDQSDHDSGMGKGLPKKDN